MKLSKKKYYYTVVVVFLKNPKYHQIKELEFFLPGDFFCRGLFFQWIFVLGTF